MVTWVVITVELEGQAVLSDAPLRHCSQPPVVVARDFWDGAPRHTSAGFWCPGHTRPAPSTRRDQAGGQRGHGQEGNLVGLLSSTFAPESRGAGAGVELVQEVAVLKVDDVDHDRRPLLGLRGARSEMIRAI